LDQRNPSFRDSLGSYGHLGLKSILTGRSGTRSLYQTVIVPRKAYIFSGVTPTEANFRVKLKP